MVLSRIYYILFVPNSQIFPIRLQESGPGKIGIDIWGESRIKTRSRVRLPSSRFLICVCFGMMESDFSVASATIFGRLFFLSGCFHFCVVESGVQGYRDYSEITEIVRDFLFRSPVKPRRRRRVGWMLGSDVDGDGLSFSSVYCRRAGMKTDKYFGLNTTTSAYIPISKTTKKTRNQKISESFLWH